jgi:tRNA pseudouridine13 synthase
MKLKSLPEDFRVEELTSVRPSRGPFALYRLEKKGIGTPEAISAILQDWNLPRKSISYGGLKDRHAVTTQYLTIHRGPNESHEDRSYRLEYLGQCPHEYHAQDIRANRFSIRLRNLEQSEHQEIERRCEAVKTIGIVNYFDDQRFGSIGYSGELIAVPWCLGNYERALYLAMAEENSHDRGREKEQKAIMREGWGDWLKLKQELDRSHRRSVVTYLVDHPTDFKRAVALIRQDMRSIYLSAFQSWVWNRWLSKLIENSLGAERCLQYESRCGTLSIPSSSASIESLRWLKNTELPLPSARQHEWDEATLPALDEILQGLGITRREMRLKYPRDTFFSRGKRSTWLNPAHFEYRWGTDELHNRRLTLDMSFELPRGCYATMVVRAISSEEFGEAEDDGEQDDPGVDQDLSDPSLE